VGARPLPGDPLSERGGRAATDAAATDAAATGRAATDAAATGRAATGAPATGAGAAARAPVTLAAVTPQLRAAVLALAPHPTQERFSGRAAQTLPLAERDPHRLPVAVLAGDEPVGFFVLDDGPGLVSLASDPRAIALRAFYIDRRHQGRGAGSAALRALPAFVRAHWPQATSVVLTVNVTNPPAIRTYQRAGFRDTGRMDLRGSEGPQHVLELDL
jgi:ribosomal protein S18 acetylase RimI-like enzyme